MASQALYRKWRSQTFDELVGQEHVVQTLRNAIRTGRLGHAYLFTGPRGVGKTTVARLLAKAVNCEAAVEQRPCDRCDPCRATAEGRAVDVIEMDAASHTGVDDAREIIERVQFRPTSYRTKVYVIDETHMLSTAAFNALLKTLEEPPAHVLFILATTEFHKVPATIVSRCQRFVFNRHSLSGIAEHLDHVAAAEGVRLEAGVAELIARAATGAMRDALSLLDQLLAGGDGTMTLAQTQALLGATENADVVSLIGALAAADLPAAVRLITKVVDGGADMRQFARDLVETLRSLMLLAATGDSSTLDLPEETLSELQALSSQIEIERLVAWLKLFSNLDYQIKNSPFGQLPLELAVVELLAVPAQAPEAAVATRGAPARTVQAPLPAPRGVPRPSEPARVETASGAGPAAETTAPRPAAVDDGATPQPPAQLAEPPEERTPAPTVLARPTEVIEVEDNAAFTLEEVEAIWPRFIAYVQTKDRIAYALLEDVKPINIEGQIVVLLAGKGKWQQGRLEQERTLRLLERILTMHLKNTARIRVTVNEQEEMPDARKLLQHARNDQLVRAALNIFGADIIGIDRP